MSFDKYMGKERRKKYRGAKSVDRSCRNHGTCKYCLSNRMFNNLKRQAAAIYEDFYLQNLSSIGGVSMYSNEDNSDYEFNDDIKGEPGKMTLYNVNVETVGHSYISVEAGSEEEAMNRVQESDAISKINCGELENIESTAVEADCYSSGLYSVHIETIGHFSINVKAESKQEAIDKVQESDAVFNFDYGKLENIESTAFDAYIAEDSSTDKLKKDCNKTVINECRIAMSKGMGR